MLKRFFLKIYSFFVYLSNGLKSAEKIAFGNKSDALDDGMTYEQQQEHDSVWQDLLKGELTQRVIDLRYETAHADRESKKYQYIGGGNAKKRNIFEYNGNIENSNNLDIFLVQENHEDIATLTNSEKTIRTYRLKITYDFISRFRLDAYTKKVVIKKDNNRYVVDFYVSKYLEKYNNEHKFFMAEINRVVSGDRRSDILLIDKLSFCTFNSFGIPDGVSLSFNNFEFLSIVEYDGNFILRFKSDLENTSDYIDSVYDEKSEKKFLNKDKRETFKENFSVIDEKIRENEENDKNYIKMTELLEKNGES